jgi:hypothetical protein
MFSQSAWLHPASRQSAESQIESFPATGWFAADQSTAT